MATYNVSFKPSVEQDLKKLSKKLVARVLAKSEALAERPFLRQAVKLEGSEGLYRLRVGDYRIIYGVDVQQRQVIIHYVRHRRDAYRRLR